ncbi:MAG TPA: tetratricopeptide repeat protein [Verrucomicrobiae bacterium]|nr:tetratricopeptide repeat protein [Verrucomicrobiae bacterium]
MKTSFFTQWFGSPAVPAQETVEAQAERGVADAQFTLGVKFANAKGAAQDYAQAANWYRKAAEQGHALAQLNLGVMYAEGQGMVSDKAQSMLWIDRAAHLGDAGAQHRLGINHHRASLDRFPVNASESRIEAYKWLQLSDDQGYRNSDMARGLVNLQMTNEEVADANRRVADFVAGRPEAVLKGAL